MGSYTETHNLEKVESGARYDNTIDRWPEWKQIECERRHREAYVMEDLSEDTDDECAKLAIEGKALELGLLLVKRAEATIQRRVNLEMGRR
jgi:hypothetical protein